MLHTAIKVRLYPTLEQQILLSGHFGCARWWWNYALNKSIETYKETGKSLNQSALNALSLDTSGKYLASILTEIEGKNPAVSTEGKVIGLDLGLTHFAITSDGSKFSKYDNPRH
jgi:transposase